LENRSGGAGDRERDEAEKKEGVHEATFLSGDVAHVGGEENGPHGLIAVRCGTESPAIIGSRTCYLGELNGAEGVAHGAAILRKENAGTGVEATGDDVRLFPQGLQDACSRVLVAEVEGIGRILADDVGKGGELGIELSEPAVVVESHGDDAEDGESSAAGDQNHSHDVGGEADGGSTFHSVLPSSVKLSCM